MVRTHQECITLSADSFVLVFSPGITPTEPTHASHSVREPDPGTAPSLERCQADILKFAPTEDLSSYPRSLEKDLDLLRTLLPPFQRPNSPSRPQPLQTAPPQNALRGLGVSENDSYRSTSAEDRALENGTQDSRLVVFAPREDVMYPLKGELQDLGRKRGVEVDVKGWGDVLEGGSRRECSWRIGWLKLMIK